VRPVRDDEELTVDNVQRDRVRTIKTGGGTGDRTHRWIVATGAIGVDVDLVRDSDRNKELALDGLGHGEQQTHKRENADSGEIHERLL